MCFIDSDPIRLSSWNEARSCRQKESCIHLCCYGNRYGGQSFPGTFWQLGRELWLLVRPFPLLCAVCDGCVQGHQVQGNNTNAKLMTKKIAVLCPILCHFRFLILHLFHMARISREYPSIQLHDLYFHSFLLWKCGLPPIQHMFVWECPEMHTSPLSWVSSVIFWENNFPSYFYSQ